MGRDTSHWKVEKVLWEEEKGISPFYGKKGEILNAQERDTGVWWYLKDYCWDWKVPFKHGSPRLPVLWLPLSSCWSQVWCSALTDITVWSLQNVSFSIPSPNTDILQEYTYLVPVWSHKMMTEQSCAKPPEMGSSSEVKSWELNYYFYDILIWYLFFNVMLSWSLCS